MRDQHFELKPRIVVVTFDPIDHVAAIGSAGRTDTIAINKTTTLKYLGYPIHDVGVSFATPIAADLVHKLLSITGRAAWIRLKDDVAGVRNHFRVPAITPVVVPGALWPAVNQNCKGVFPARIKISGLDYEAVNL